MIVGEGDEQARLEALIAELGRGDRVRLLGYRPETCGLYEAMDVFALSSLREGLPNVLLEAMALEVPVVATRVAGVPRLIHDGENGLLVEPGSRRRTWPAAWPACWATRDLRDRLRQAGRRDGRGRLQLRAPGCGRVAAHLRRAARPRPRASSRPSDSTHRVMTSIARTRRIEVHDARAADDLAAAPAARWRPTSAASERRR